MQKNTISTWQLLFKNKDSLCFDIQLCLMHLSKKEYFTWHNTFNEMHNAL
jgi:hypothetical protein